MRREAVLSFGLVIALATAACGAGAESGSTDPSTTTTASSGSTSATSTGLPTTPTSQGESPASTLSLAELANVGTHRYSSEIEVLECGALAPESLYEDQLFDVVVAADQMSYDTPGDDYSPLVWDRAGPDEFTREATSNEGEHIEYTLTLSEQGMVYYYEIDTVPCRRITWRLIDG